MTMGQRILQARLAAGMSQRELAGEEITRNMLSSLEHDAATPSVATLRYLARRLGRPVSYFLGEDDFSEGVAAFESGAWRKSLELMTPAERRWLEPLALLREAEQAASNGRIPYARELLERLEGNTSPLYGPELRRKAAMIRCRCGISADIPEDNALLMKAERALKEKRFSDAERYLLARDHRDARWHHLMGQCRFQAGDYAAAKEHYHRCEESYDVRSLLEICYRELEDFRMAYFYAKKG
jgi:transcriptional regulator with XRE-family HTH domain